VTGLRVLVLGCGHCGVPETLSRIAGGSDVSVVWRRSLCDTMEPLLSTCRPDAVVFLAARNVELQARAAEGLMRGGVHPLRIRFLDAWRLFPDAMTVGTHVHAAIARLRAAEPVERAPTRPTNAFRGAVPRRSLIYPVARFRAPVPRIEPSRCRAPNCDLCVKACPEQAIARGVPPSIDPSACTSCAMCLAACPTDAAGHRVLSRSTLEAEARALADAPGLGLLVACPSSLLDDRIEGLGLAPGGWRVLEVPSVGALRPVDVLRFLALGFKTVVGLGAGECCPEAPGPFAVASAFLVGIGDPGRVAYWDLSAPPPDLREGATSHHQSIPMVESLHELAVRIDSHADRIPLPGRGAGLVTVDPAACTMCGLCVERCWSDSLAMEEPRPGALTLTFNVQACDGCEQCVEACPERAVSLQHAIEPPSRDRTVLKRDEWVLCTACGNRVAPRAMVDRVASQSTLRAGLDLCPACKPVRLLAGAPNASP